MTWRRTAIEVAGLDKLQVLDGQVGDHVGAELGPQGLVVQDLEEALTHVAPLWCFLWAEAPPGPQAFISDGSRGDLSLF